VSLLYLPQLIKITNQIQDRAFEHAAQVLCKNKFEIIRSVVLVRVPLHCLWSTWYEQRKKLWIGKERRLYRIRYFPLNIALYPPMHTHMTSSVSKYITVNNVQSAPSCAALHIITILYIIYYVAAGSGVC